MEADDRKGEALAPIPARRVGTALLAATIPNTGKNVNHC